MIKILCNLTTEFEKDYLNKLDKMLALEGVILEFNFLSFSNIDELEGSYNNPNTFIFFSIHSPLLENTESKEISLRKKLSSANIILVMDTKSSEKAMDYSKGNRLVKYVLNTDSPTQLHLPTLRTFFQEKDVLNAKKYLNEMAKKLNKFLSENLTQIEKVKKIHKKLVKFRSEVIRPIEINSRYAPGSASGGEFYDIVKSDHEIFFVMTSCNNYDSSSKVLSFIQSIKYPKSTSPNIAKDYLSVNESFKSITLVDKDFNYLLVKVILSSAEVLIEGVGNFTLISNRSLNDKNKNSVILDAFSPDSVRLFLNRGDRILFLSPGVLRNVKDRLISNQTLNNFIESKIDLEPKDLINEVFFQLKNISESSFLEYDATLITLEIDPNAILKI